jgi:hypothetical protein
VSSSSIVVLRIAHDLLDNVVQRGTAGIGSHSLSGDAPLEGPVSARLPEWGSIQTSSNVRENANIY